MRSFPSSLLFLASLAAAAPVTVTVRPNEPVRIRTSAAEFEVAPSGYTRAYLLKGAERLTLEHPTVKQTGDTVRVAGAPAQSFTIDFARVKITDTPRGKRVDIPAKSSSGALERTVTLEVSEDAPSMLLSSVSYKNTGAAPVRIEMIVTQAHRLNASLADPKAAPYRMWSFHGSAPKWGQDDVVELAPKFSRPNDFGAADAGGFGGGIPVVAFWTTRTGMAVGHLETLPVTLSIPVAVGSDGHPQVSVDMNVDATLKPGETYAAPRTFEMVFSGDYYEPLRAYSIALQRRGWTVPKPTNEDYAVSWCGWGYEFNVTSKEMLGIIPKLKELGIHWATLDDRWFDTYGDWNPRSDTFPGRSIQDMVAEYHRNGIKAQIWWLPIGAEIPGHQTSSHKYIESNVVKQHPDWLVLDPSGKPAMMVRDLATLCPALKEVQDYHRRLTTKFIRDWGFDGHKLDNIYSVAPCYNPKHHHKSPQDSVNAMADVYRAIFETTRELKPESVTQACPCGTPPSFAWLRYMDQAVTADPIGGAQVRRRVKMYKALLGPRAAVYGDHVELSEMVRTGKGWEEIGRDFASSIGTGAVVGTKFVWPQTDAKYKGVALDAEKDRVWKKWIGLYNAKMLSRGEFRNLYTIGYDTPEAYAIEKDGRMYYAFYARGPHETYRGEIELRGLKPGPHHVVDYVNSKDYGSVSGPAGRLKAEFTGSLLLEVQ